MGEPHPASTFSACQNVYMATHRRGFVYIQCKCRYTSPHGLTAGPLNWVFTSEGSEVFVGVSKDK